MKALTTILTFLLLFSFSNIKGQEDTINKPFRIGLHASPSISWMKPSTNDYESNGVRMGFSYGALADFHITNNYYLSTGLDITYAGGKLNYKDSINYTDTTLKVELDPRNYKLQYLHIPLMIKMKTQQIGWWTYFANIGLGTSIRIKAEAKDKTGPNTTKEKDIAENVALFRESLIIGAGAEYAVGKDISIIGQVNFNNGFTYILTGENKITGKKENAIANYLELKLGVIF